MTDTSIELAGASPLASLLAVPNGLIVELSTTLNLTTEQEEIALAAKRAHIIHGLTAIQRARLMRDLRKALNNPPPGGSGHTGWDSICRSDFDTNATDANREIAGLEAVEAVFSGEGGVGLPHPMIPAEIGRSHLNELGRLSDLEQRMRLAALIRDGQVTISQRAIRAKAAELKLQSTKVGLKPVAKPLPTPPASLSKLPIPPKGSAAGFGVFKEISRSKFGDLPERDQEFGFLAGKEAANAKFETDLTALLAKASRGNVGKIMRIKALAAALHREFKGVGDRYQGRWDKDCMYPTYMTLWQHIWAEDETFHLHDELEAVRKDIAEANRHFGIAVMRLFNDDLEITP